MLPYLYQRRQHIHLSIVFTRRTCNYFWTGNGWTAGFVSKVKPATGHRLAAWGWLAAATLLANGPMVPSSNHTQPPDIKMLSRTGQALGLHWAPSGEPQVLNG